jgi:steroid 5-alpha reductase family enzyme
MRDRPARFFVAWTLQALWVFVSMAAVLVLVASRTRAESPGVVEILGWLTWLVGFGIEVVADRQKQAHAAAHPGRFIDSGLWAYSRHPNYLGESLLWKGLFLSGFAIYHGGEWLSVLSPLLVFVLLRFVSGVPLLEARSDEKFAGDADYEAYKARTPVLVPWPRR